MRMDNERQLMMQTAEINVRDTTLDTLILYYITIPIVSESYVHGTMLHVRMYQSVHTNMN